MKKTQTDFLKTEFTILGRKAIVVIDGIGGRELRRTFNLKQKKDRQAFLYLISESSDLLIMTACSSTNVSNRSTARGPMCQEPRKTIIADGR